MLTLATTACANKLADFMAPLVENKASKMQLMYLVARLCPDQLEELTIQTKSALREEVITRTHQQMR